MQNVTSPKHLEIKYFARVRVLNHPLSMTYHDESIFKIVSEYDQEIPQSQTADNPVVP